MNEPTMSTEEANKITEELLEKQRQIMEKAHAIVSADPSQLATFSPSMQRQIKAHAMRKLKAMQKGAHWAQSPTLLSPLEKHEDAPQPFKKDGQPI